MPPGNGWPRAENTWAWHACQIGQMMFSYSVDNDGNYPDGQSSTEVFQKLLDGGYANDPNIFYIPLPGKIKPVVGQKLKPENVSWDVTSGVDSRAPDGLPLLFMTGYKATYAPGAAAVPVVKPYPQFKDELLTWFQWWHEPSPSPGIAVHYYTGPHSEPLVKYLKLDTTANPEGYIPNFVPADFDPKGKTYRQLTPDGPVSQ